MRTKSSSKCSSCLHDSEMHYHGNGSCLDMECGCSLFNKGSDDSRKEIIENFWVAMESGLIIETRQHPIFEDVYIYHDPSLDRELLVHKEYFHNMVVPLKTSKTGRSGKDEVK